MPILEPNRILTGVPLSEQDKMLKKLVEADNIFVCPLNYALDVEGDEASKTYGVRYILAVANTERSLIDKYKEQLKTTGIPGAILHLSKKVKIVNLDVPVSP